MKPYKYKILRKNMQMYSNVEEFLNNHEKYSESFYWSPPKHASGRRKLEFDTKLHFILNDVEYELEQDLTCSCQHFYYSSSIYVNGKKKDIRAIKKLLNIGEISK